MAINMSNVTTIMHNNKEVSKIEDSNGNILWQKQQSVVLESITLSGQTTTLQKKAAFSFGGTVTAHYSDSSTANVTSSTTFSGYNMNTEGTYTVTASYTEDGVTKTATYSLYVNPWKQLWSGSKTATYQNSSGTSLTTVYTMPNNTGINPRVRISFSFPNNPSTTSTFNTKKFYIRTNNSTVVYDSSTAPSSPRDITINMGTSTFNFVPIEFTMYSSSAYQIRVALLSQYNSTNKCRNFCVYGERASTAVTSSPKIGLTITKIEQYIS